MLCKCGHKKLDHGMKYCTKCISCNGFEELEIVADPEDICGNPTCSHTRHAHFSINGAVKKICIRTGCGCLGFIEPGTQHQKKNVPIATISNDPLCSNPKCKHPNSHHDVMSGVCMEGDLEGINPKNRICFCAEFRR